MKRIIAYSSIAHMNFVVLGLFSGNLQGIEGAIFLMICHGVVSSGLFFVIGVIYDRYKTRNIYYYGGLFFIHPEISVVLLLLALGNVGFPMTGNFVGELLILTGIADKIFYYYYLVQ